MDTLIPVLGILAGIVIPVAVFIWQYLEGKGKRETVLAIAKHLDDPAKVEQLIAIFDERKKQPVDYRRGGVITFFVGLGLFLFGLFFLGAILKGSGLLIMAIGAGTFLAGHLYPNTSEELTSAVDSFEKK